MRLVLDLIVGVHTRAVRVYEVYNFLRRRYGFHKEEIAIRYDKVTTRRGSDLRKDCSDLDRCIPR